jgi:hypothetical protein
VWIASFYMWKAIPIPVPHLATPVGKNAPTETQENGVPSSTNQGCGYGGGKLEADDATLKMVDLTPPLLPVRMISVLHMRIDRHLAAASSNLYFRRRISYTAFQTFALAS